jgi:hypothetical protein
MFLKQKILQSTAKVRSCIEIKNPCLRIFNLFKLVTLRMQNNKGGLCCRILYKLKLIFSCYLYNSLLLSHTYTIQKMRTLDILKSWKFITLLRNIKIQILGHGSWVSERIFSEESELRHHQFLRKPPHLVSHVAL